MDDGAAPRVPTHLWVEAEIRRLGALGHAVYVIAKGDLAGGMILQKISDLSGRCRLLGLERDLAGKLGWVDVVAGDDAVPERDADAYIERARRRDPDLWVVEIEDRTLTARLELY